jgi:hypothetical protein
MPIKAKTIEVNGETYCVMQDGHPVYVHDDGKEAPFDVPDAHIRIPTLQNEARGHRGRAKELEDKLKTFDARWRRGAANDLDRAGDDSPIAMGDEFSRHVILQLLASPAKA